MNNTDTKLTLDGASGKQYIFDLFTFDDFSELKDAFHALPAIYVFTRRSLGVDGYTHDLAYLGETENLSERFNNHHKEVCIVAHHANCIGLYGVSSNVEDLRQIEADILATYDFPCNEQLN